MSAEELRIEIRDRIAWLWLNRPPLNTLTPDLLERLRVAHVELTANRDVRAIVLGSQNQKFFSNGLDPEFMLKCTRAERAEYFRTLMEMSIAMYSFPKLELAAIGGHAMAGGAVLGILCDFRFMAEGKHRFSFSEVRVGLTIPGSILGILEGVVGPQHLRDAAMLGELFRPEEAFRIGLVDRVVPPDELHEQAERYIKSLFEIPQAGMTLVKEDMRAARLANLRRIEDLTKLEPFLEGNFEEGMRAVLERRRPRFVE